MFGGKSKRLIEILREAVSQGIPTLALKPMHDTRDGGMIRSHDGQEYPAVLVPHKDYLAIPVEMVAEFNIRNRSKQRIIAIDEIQFFSLSFSLWLYDYVRRFDDSLTLIVAGIVRDAFDKPMGSGPFWQVYADEVEWYAPICPHCGQRQAETHLWKGEGYPGPGGADLYESVCRECWQEAMRLKEQESRI